jgi:two-component system chemotaxis response regulator CheY
MEERLEMKKRVLIADDSSTVRKFVAFSLRLQGLEVIPAVDGMDALEKASRTRIDLAVVDLNMPNMNGFELIQHLRNSEDYRDLPIIILSSEKSEESVRRGKEVGANVYLTKPFDAKMIQYQVAKYLSIY